ncbi:MAG TPA: gamma-glutamyltransferase, partial [Candidatus Caenarcaniphilales bacterium]|nr:gamma-glutamyltransferase [Candidatus Caenarcaniphilales bacterium]
VALPALAETLGRLASEGPDAAYSGSLAGRAAAYLADRGSPLRAEDFAVHRSDWGAPVAIDYRGITSLSHPPNSSGPIALEMLGLLARFPPPPRAAFTSRGVEDADWVHLGLEAARIGLADRDAVLTDPQQMAADAVERLLDPQRLDELASSIDRQRVGAVRPTPLTRGGTIYLATADAEGLLVSLIESNYSGFGSGLVDPETGIAYQNRGAQFTLDSRHVNVLAPGKRTAHTLTPGMLMRAGRPWMAHGSMGGAIQPQVFTQFVSAVVDGELDIATALAAPRWAAGDAYELQPPLPTVLERRYSDVVADELRRRGHDVQWTEQEFSSSMGHAQAVQLLVDESGGRSLTAASDPRSHGAALAW